MSEEHELLWLRDAYDIDRIITTLENCDGVCATCEPDECSAETRKIVRDLALIVKDLALSLVQLITVATKKPVGSDVI